MGKRNYSRLRRWWETWWKHNKVELDDMIATVMILAILIVAVLLVVLIIRTVINEWNDGDNVINTHAGFNDTVQLALV